MLYVALEEWLATDDDRTLFEVIMATLGSLQATMAGFPLAGFPLAGARAGAGARRADGAGGASGLVMRQPGLLGWPELLGD
jgi:hypothetical protein